MMDGDELVIRIEIAEAPEPERYPAGPEGVGLYAIGDVHGRDDLLAALLAAIRADGAARARNVVVCLGDYVDRGPASAGVIERLSRFAAGDLTLVPLKGNHEHLMLQFLADPEEAGVWLANGAVATLESYGVPVGPGWPERSRYVALRDALERSLPPHHRRFLDTLATSHTVGDYLFVHAGVRPGVAIDRQDPHDLIWIRGAFLNSSEAFGPIVVHGHSITRTPDWRANRIGIDTGAFMSGRLSALAIADGAVRLISAVGEPSPFYTDP